MDGYMIQWDQILKLSEERIPLFFIRDAERLGHGSRATGGLLAIINEEPEQEQSAKRRKQSQDMETELLTTWSSGLSQTLSSIQNIIQNYSVYKESEKFQCRKTMNRFQCWDDTALEIIWHRCYSSYF